MNESRPNILGNRFLGHLKLKYRIFPILKRTTHHPSLNHLPLNRFSAR